MSSTRSPNSRRGLGLVVAVLGIAAMIAAAFFWLRSAGVPGIAPDDVPCRRLGFPCTLSEVPPDVLRQSLAIGEDVVGRLMSGDSPASIEEWLGAQPPVVEVILAGPLLAFRLDGGRRVWTDRTLLGLPELSAPLAPAARAAPRPLELRPNLVDELLSRLFVPLYAQEVAPGPERRGGVVGQDLNGDGKINQRDPRRALVLISDPGPPGAEAAVVEGFVRGTPGYEDGVSVRVGPEADLYQYINWNDFDIVHVQAPTATGCEDPTIGTSATVGGHADEVQAAGESLEDWCYWFLSTGMVVPEALYGRPESLGARPDPDGPNSAALAAASENGVEIFAVQGANSLEWRLFLSEVFLDQAYPAGVRRAIVFLNSSNQYGLRTVSDLLAGDPRQSSVIAWEVLRSRSEGTRAASAFYSSASLGFSVGDILANRLAYTCDGSESAACERSLMGFVSADLRAREIVSIWTPDPSIVSREPVEDDHVIESLMVQDWWSAQPSITVDVVVEGIEDADVDILVRLELNGAKIAEQPLSEGFPADESFARRLTFRNAPISASVRTSPQIELEAVVSLPRGGESRYSAFLSSSDCFWEAEVTGPVLSGRFSGAGIRLVSTDRFGALQFDTGELMSQDGGPNAPIGLTFPISSPPREGTFGAAGSLVGFWSTGGIPLSFSEAGLLEVTTLRRSSPDSAGPREIAGVFEADFTGFALRPEAPGGRLRTVQGATHVKGRFMGRFERQDGCGSETFRWFDAIARAAGGGSR